MEIPSRKLAGTCRSSLPIMACAIKVSQPLHDINRFYPVEACLTQVRGGIGVPVACGYTTSRLLRYDFTSENRIAIDQYQNDGHNRNDQNQRVAENRLRLNSYQRCDDHDSYLRKGLISDLGSPPWSNKTA